MSKFVLTAQLKLRAPDNLRQVSEEIKNALSFKSTDIKLNIRNTQKVTKDLQTISKQTNATKKDVENLGNAFGVSLGRFTVFSIASRAVGLFSNKLSSAIEEAITFQQEVVRLSQVTDESIKSLSKVTDQITKLSTSFGVSSKELQSVTTVLAQAGLQSRDLEIALNALAKTALAPTFGDIKQTAEGAIAILAQFEKGTKALERQLGAVNEVSAKFAVESEDLISAVRRTGGVFKASGGELEDLLALFTSVRATTRESSETIATGLRTIFTRIQRPKTIEFMRQFGVELTYTREEAERLGKTEGAFIGPYEAIRRLSEELGDLPEGDLRLINVAEELGGFRQIGKVIPLLQQFKVAEEARQAALAGATSLEQDVQDSQVALAIQINKVREEFLALIRDFSNTSTFNIFLKTTLNLTSSLIKLADSLKELLPIFAAIAAVKFTKSVGSFFSGLGAGLTKGPRARFNSGGLVPGSGNTDTVPAMLTPGEFVIRKNSVKKLGVDTLMRMNENRYTIGGEAEDKSKPEIRGIKPEGKSVFAHLTASKKATTSFKKKYKDAQSLYSNIGIDIPSSWNSDWDKKLNNKVVYRQQLAKYARRYDILSSYTKSKRYQLPAEDAKRFERVKRSIKSNFIKKVLTGPKYYDNDKRDVYPKLGPLFLDAVRESGESTKEGKKLVRSINQYSVYNQPYTYFSEKKQKYIKTKQRTMIPYGERKNFRLGKPMLEEKKSGGSISGDSGTDTIPALLTPGEFVFNKQAAQRIGYGNLDKMNKQGVSRFAKGGPVGVQKFRTGGKAQQGESGGFGIALLGFTSAVTFASDKLAEFTKSADGSSTALSRSIESLTSLTTTIFGVNFLLKQFGADLSVFGRGKGGLGDLLGGFTKRGRTKGASFSEGFKLPEIQKAIKPYVKGEGKVDSLTRLLIKANDPGLKAERSNRAAELRLLRQKPTSLLGKAGQFLGKASQGGGRLGKLAGFAGRGISAVGGVGGGALGAVASFAGPAAAAVGGLKLLSNTIASVIDAENQKIKAIEEGNAVEAGRYAVMAEMDGFFGGLLQGITNVSYGLSNLGLISEDSADNVAKFFVGAEEFRNTKILAESQALATKANKEYTESLKDLEERQKKVALGELTATEFFNPTSGISKPTKNIIDSYKSTIEADKLFGEAIEDYTKKMQINAKLQEDAIKRNQNPRLRSRSPGSVAALADARTKLVEDFDKAGKLNTEATKEAAENINKIIEDFSPTFQKLTQESFLSAGQDVNRGLLEFKARLSDLYSTLGQTPRGLEILEKLTSGYVKQAEQLQKNIEFWKSVNLGLRDISGRISATNASFDVLRNSIEAGSTDLKSAQTILNAATTSAALGIDPAVFTKAEEQLKKSLENIGATPDQLKKTDTFRAIYEAQRSIPDIIKTLQGEIGTPEGSKITEKFQNQLVDSLRKANIGEETIKAIRSNIEKYNLNTPEALMQILSGDIEGIIEAALGPLGTATKDQFDAIINGIININEELVSLTKERIAIEKDLVDARKRSLDLELDAREAIADFGGSLFTSKDRLDLFTRRLNLSLKSVGAGTIRGGGASEIIAAQAELTRSFAETERKRSSSAVSGTNQLSGASGAEEASRQAEIANTQEAIIDYTKQRIDLIKEEISIAERKNQLERDAIDKLLGGDIEGFIQGQSAAAAASALRSGDTQIARLFGPAALGAAVKDLREQNIGSKELESATRTALQSVGFRDEGMARVYAGTTPEIEALQRTGRQLASTLVSGGENLIKMQQMRVDTQQVIINVANSNIRKSLGIGEPSALQIPDSQNPLTQPTSQQFPIDQLKEIFNGFSDSIKQLQNTQLSVKLDATNVNVNFNGAGFLQTLASDVRTEVLKQVKNEITNKLEIGNDGKARFKEGIV